MPPPRLQRPRPAPWDTFGGSDPVVHAAMHEAMLAALTPEDEAAIASESVRLGLAAGESGEAMAALYGAEALRLALLPREPRRGA
ncbi:MAG TPA: hypothetical protein VLF66_07250 [Thermoanaerobaculia bacterium]|nr:hypothetical protein [Thermoanaerobaculia bacterium]